MAEGILAIDIGGTKTLLAVFDNNRQIVEKQLFKTPREYPEFLDSLSTAVAKLTNKDFRVVVAGVPARLDRQSGVAIAFGNLSWTNVPIRDEIKRITGVKTIIENDAKLAGLSEAQLVISKYKKVLYLTISTGINSALVVAGQLDQDTIDSETGQLLIEHEGKLQDWEDFGSGRAFSEKFGKNVSELDDPKAWTIIAKSIGIGLINLITTFNPDAVIVGGGVGSHLEKFQTQLEAELKSHENPMFSIPPLLKAQRPEEAVIYGCYQLAAGK